MAQSFLDKLRDIQDVNKGYGEPQRTDEQQKYDDIVSSQGVLDAVGITGITPPGVTQALQALNDMQIAKMEKENPNLAPNNPYTARNRNRFSTLGQIFAGFGYDPRYPTPDILTRVKNVVTGSDYVPRQAFTNVYNRGIPVFEVMGGAQVSSGGWETGDGGDGPAAARGTSNFGGRESMVEDTDRSGYA